jgi:intracellular multiplication protein IcmW
MPDLSHTASGEYWNEYTDPMIYRVIIFMESVEDWTLDGDPELEKALSELGQVLDNIESVDMSQVGHEMQFIRLAGNIKTGRGLRLLQAIDVAHPGSASKVLVYAEETTSSPFDPAGFFLKRNIAFERLRLLSRAFSEYRLRLVERALEGDE